MTDEDLIRRFRIWYATLIRLYPKHYHDRFADPMVQTFEDILREQSKEKNRLLSCAFWLFVETSVEICKENLRVIIMQNLVRELADNSYRIAIGIALTAALLLLLFYGAVVEEGDSPGPMFFASIITLITGVLIARLEPYKMFYALFATAVAQVLFTMFAMIAWGQYFEVLVFNLLFIALWIASASLFRRAGKLKGAAENA